MKLITLLTLFAFFYGTQQVQVLKDNVHNAYNLVVDYKTNTLFFSYSSLSQEKTVIKSVYMNLNGTEFGEISGINSGIATAYDRNNHVVYLGGKDGLYTFDYATKSAKNLGITNYSIWQMFHCPVHGLYFTTFDPEEKAFVYFYGQVGPVPELNTLKTRLIAVGQKHDIYFANSAGIFVLKTIDGVLYNIHLEVFTVNGFASDINGKLYFSTPNAIYYINEDLRIMERVVSVEEGDSIWGVAFARDGSIIYALDDKIVMKK